MARLARVVVPGLPHHVTQRGNRREPVFFGGEDHQAYLDLIGAAARRARTGVWAYRLILDHVHFIMVPSHEDGLRAVFGEAHRRYTARINARFKQTGHLWEGRVASVVMDGPPDRGRALCGDEPGQGWVGGAAQDWPGPARGRSWRAARMAS